MRASLRFKTIRAALCVVLLATQFGAIGCGNAPLQPAPESSHNVKVPAMRTPIQLPPEDDDGRGGAPTFNTPENWAGGPRTLPVGPATTPGQVLYKLTQLENVQVAKAEFERRGYIRRTEDDTVLTTHDYTTAVICYQKPGRDVKDVEAIIMVVSKRSSHLVTMYEPDPTNPSGTPRQWLIAVGYFETQIGGGLVQRVHMTDQGDTLQFLDTPEDPCLVVTSFIPTSAKASLQQDGRQFSFSPSELNGGTNGSWTSGTDTPDWGLDGTFTYDLEHWIDYWNECVNKFREWAASDAVQMSMKVVVVAVVTSIILDEAPGLIPYFATPVGKRLLNVLVKSAAALWGLWWVNPPPPPPQ